MFRRFSDEDSADRVSGFRFSVPDLVGFGGLWFGLGFVVVVFLFKGQATWFLWRVQPFVSWRSCVLL